MTLAERGQRFNETPEWRVRRIAERQHGLVRHDQARTAGVGEAAIGRRLGSGLWHVVLPRVYLISGSVRTGRQAAMAGALWAGDDAVVSHRTAGVLWGMDVETTRVEVTVPYGQAPRHDAVVLHRTQTLDGVDRDTIHGIP